MRFYDRLLTDTGWRQTLQRLAVDPASAWLDYLRRATVIVADNVAHYLYAVTDQEVWNVETDFPNLAPPFENFWLEHRFPSRGVSREFGAYRLPAAVQDMTVGVQVRGQPLADGWRAVGMVLVAERDVLDFVGVFEWQLDAGGQFTRDAHGQFNFWEGIPRHSPGGTHAANARLSDLLLTTEFAISLMHCQNVRLIGEMPPAGLSRKFKRRTGQPLTRYRVLDIGPMTTLLDQAGASTGEAGGLQRALHICRGHFKHYGGRGLFGKYPGMFWWPEHWRGTPAHGTVIKRYNVHPPQATPGHGAS